MAVKVDTDNKSAPRGVPQVQVERMAPPAPAGQSGQRAKIAYIMSRFPVITETFVLYEMLALEEQGLQVELYPLQRERTEVMHPEARPFVARANFQPLFSWPIFKSQFYYLLRKPLVYLSILWTLIRANWGSSRYLFGALGFFPKAVHFARLMKADRHHAYPCALCQPSGGRGLCHPPADRHSLQLYGARLGSAPRPAHALREGERSGFCGGDFAI